MSERKLLVTLLASGLTTPAFATTPAPWIEERAICLDAAEQRIDRSTRLSTRAARHVANRIILECRETIPRLLLNTQERANIEGADRYEIIQKLLRKTSR